MCLSINTLPPPVFLYRSKSFEVEKTMREHRLRLAFKTPQKNHALSGPLGATVVPQMLSRTRPQYCAARFGASLRPLLAHATAKESECVVYWHSIQ